MEKLLTISVAAYNVEKYIEECLVSFINEAFINNIEVLIIMMVQRIIQHVYLPDMKKSTQEYSGW